MHLDKSVADNFLVCSIDISQIPIYIYIASMTVISIWNDQPNPSEVGVPNTYTNPEYTKIYHSKTTQISAVII